MADSMGGRSVGLKETNNHKMGRSGSGTEKKSGPAKSPKHNPTKSGGITRATKSG